MAVKRTETSTNALRALIYARVSKDKSGRAKSVAEQVAECEAECEDNGWSVVDVIRDADRSASKFATRVRENWPKVQECLASGAVDVLVMWENSRGTRRLDGFVELRDLCERHGVKLSYGGSTFDMSKASDRMRTSQDAVTSEFESHRGSERTKRGLAGAAKDGKPHGKVLFGYLRRYDEVTRKYVGTVEDPAAAAIVREVAARFLAAEPIYSIAADLNRREVKTADGAGWSQTRVRRLLANETYTGVRTWNGESFPADWPALISPEQHERIMARLSDPARRLNRDRTDVAYLLSGIARCGKCGGVMYRAKSFRDNRHVYACHPGKGHLIRDLRQTDEWVEAVVVEVLSSPTLVDELTAAADDPEAAAARTRVDELNAELAELRAAYKARRISLGSFMDFEADTLRQIADAERQARSASPVSDLVLAVAGEGATETWEDKLTLDQKRALVRELVTVTIHPTPERGRRFDTKYVEVARRRQ
jgi:DNA invertase Pin-like site-specific DNA recombinase